MPANKLSDHPPTDLHGMMPDFMMFHKNPVKVVPSAVGGCVQAIKRMPLKEENSVFTVSISDSEFIPSSFEIEQGVRI